MNVRLALASRKIRIAAAALLLGGALAVVIGWYWWGRHEEHEARRLLAERDFVKALTHLQRALWLRPSDTALHLLAAQTARRCNDYPEAMEHARRCEGVPELAEALALEYVLWRVAGGDLQEGVRQVASCHEKSDSSCELVLEAYLSAFLATSLRESGGSSEPLPGLAHRAEFREAEWAADEWLRRQTGAADQVQGRVWRGRLHALVGRHAEAVADLRAALDLDANHFEARWYLAAQIAQELPRESERHVEFLLERHPENHQVRFLLAHLRRNLGKLDDARKLLDEMLAAGADDPKLLAERGMVELEQGNAAQAEEWLRRAERAGYDRPELLLALGRCMRLAGRLGEAQQYEARFAEHEARRGGLPKP